MKNDVLNGLALFICVAILVGFFAILAVALGPINTLLFIGFCILASWAALG